MFSSLWDWLNTTHGIWTGLISAFIFIFLVFFIFKPWFVIGSHISANNGEFRFKMVNITPFKCTDLNIFLRQVVVHDLKKGCNFEFQMLEIKKNPFIYVPSIFSGIRESRPNCLQLTTEKDIRGIIESNGTYVEIIIVAKHGLSGLQSIYKKRFKHIDSIIDGNFENGFTFKISNKNSN